MSRFSPFLLLVLSGCGQGPAPAPKVVQSPAQPPPAQKPIVPSIRPRFRSGLEAFVTEARVITNLPSVGVSDENITDQQTKVEQAFARMPDPQNEVEKTLHAQAKQFTVDTWGIVQMVKLHHRTLAYGDTSGKQSVDDAVKLQKGELKPIEDALDK